MEVIITSRGMIIKGVLYNFFQGLYLISNSNQPVKVSYEMPVVKQDLQIGRVK